MNTAGRCAWWNIGLWPVCPVPKTFGILRCLLISRLQTRWAHPLKVALLKSLGKKRTWQMWRPKFVDVVGQSQQKRLFALRCETSPRCFTGEFSFDCAKDALGLDALSIKLCGKVAPHLCSHSSKFPARLASLSRDNALGTELLADVLMVALAIELRIGQHQSDPLRAICDLIKQRWQCRAVVSRSGVCF